MIRARDVIIIAWLGSLFCLCISGLEKAQQKARFQMAEASR